MRIDYKINARPNKLITLFVLMSLVLSACSSKNYPPLETTSFVTQERFAGKWFVIANIPYFAEKNKVGSYTIYRERENGIYDDIYVSRNKQFSNPEKELKGTVKPVNESNTRWQSRFYWLMKFTFHVLHVENNENIETEDYDLALLGHPSRQYGWVMARTNTIDVDRYQAAMKIFEDRGYDTAKFLKVPQLPEQIGQQGFQ